MQDNILGSLPYEIIDIILKELSVGLTLVDKNGTVIYFNNLAKELLGWNALDSNIFTCHKSVKKDKILAKLNNIHTREWHRIIKLRDRYIENTYSPVNIPGKFNGIMIITKEVTEREEAYRNTQRKANIDGLTGLYNRNFLNEIYEELLQGNNPFGAIMIDVNGLKYINDNFGHAAGDKILKEAAQVIIESVRTTDYIFRYGGDEFLVLLTTDNINTLKFISNRIKSRNTNPTVEKPLVLNLSIGYSSSLETPRHEVISRADKRMYEDKQLFYQNEGKFIINILDKTKTP